METVYIITDTYWISGIGFSALVGLGYIANVIYASNKIGDGMAVLSMFLFPMNWVQSITTERIILRFME